ncbi:DUF805 domain-containing protein [Parvularcula dongshanensis]|uniref:Uncharacterized membrane protein YhaH (DUF805 family) n=1 Tax=Parvularcula dongshanensis TaxID=1173995 RepID=A0A840I5W2_9PROT|nr:uncharacterized membrane protein YhaH (DUF805 family) [Parvularcula dongshanensis]
MERLAAALRFYVSPRGRVGRKALFLWCFVPFVVLAALADRANNAAVSTAFWLLVAWPLFVALPWRRMHDMERRGAWNLVFYVFYAVGFAFFLGEYAASEGGWAALFDGTPPHTVDRDLTASGMGGFSTVLIFLPIHLVWLYAISGRAAEKGRSVS